MHATTPEAGLQRAEALLWRSDRIVAIGSDASIRSQAASLGARVTDLGSRLLLPGFVDAHTHFLHVGVKKRRPDLRAAISKGEAMAILGRWLVANPPGTPAPAQASGGGKPSHVIGEGWDESGWPGRERPTRHDIDAVLEQAGQPGRPVVLRRICGHIAVAGSAALPLLQARWPEEVDAATGTLVERPALYLNEAMPSAPRELDGALQEACRVAHTLGVTTVGDYSQAPYRAALQRAAARGSLSVRVASSIYVQQAEAERRLGFRTARAGAGPADLRTSPRPATHDGVVALETGGEGTSPWLRDGGLKVFLDGSLGARTAALREAYLDAPPGMDGTCAGLATAPNEERRRRGSRHGCVGHPHPAGTLNWPDGEVERLVAQAHRDGVQVHAHAIGDAAIDQGLEAFAALRDPEGVRAMRHRFEHFEIVHDAQVLAAAAMGIVASSQPNFVGTWSSNGGMYEERLGPRFQLNNRFQSMRHAGIPLAFGSDGMPFGPLEGLQAAVSHPRPEQRLDTFEAVWHYTYMAAWSLHWEGEVGSLAPGKCADFVVLETPGLRDGGRAQPADWRVVQTYTGGVPRLPQASGTN